jgi:hypothetical protein
MSLPAAIGWEEMEVQLPEAQPELYLQWIAFVVELEQAIRKDPRLRSKAARRGLVYGETAQAAHGIVYQPITHQAEQADPADAAVQPIVTAEPPDLDEVAGYLQRWGEWLVEEELAMPLPEIAALQMQVIKDLRAHSGPG